VWLGAAQVQGNVVSGAEPVRRAMRTNFDTEHIFLGYLGLEATSLYPTDYVNVIYWHYMVFSLVSMRFFRSEGRRHVWDSYHSPKVL